MSVILQGLLGNLLLDGLTTTEAEEIASENPPFSVVNPTSPSGISITFQVNLTNQINNDISIGPKLNSRNMAMPSIGGYQSALNKLYIPGAIDGLVNGATLVVNGSPALRLMKTLSTGIANDYTSTPLMVLSIAYLNPVVQ